jgi:exonuclease VII small subunit
MIDVRKTPEPGKTPAKITVSMIDNDLKNGISKAEMAVKYNIKPWEVDEMFKHPFLKGRRPSRKKALSFDFVDDVSTKETGMIEAVEALQEVDPNQITLEEAIDDAIDSAAQAQDALKEAEKAVVDILSPTEYETPEETLLKAAQPSTEKEDRNDLDYANTELNEEELEMDDDTFEL